MEPLRGDHATMCLTLTGQTHCLGLELRRKESFPDCRSSVATLCKIALAGYEATQRAEGLRCAHKIRGEPRWPVPSERSNPCSAVHRNQSRKGGARSARQTAIGHHQPFNVNGRQEPLLTYCRSRTRPSVRSFPSKRRHRPTLFFPSYADGMFDERGNGQFHIRI